MKIVPYKNDEEPEADEGSPENRNLANQEPKVGSESKVYKKPDADRDEANEKLDDEVEEDFDAVEEAAESGQLENEECEISEVIVSFPKKEFSRLKEDKEDDSVVCVLRGYVDGMSEDEVFVTFTKAAVVNSKKTVQQRQGKLEQVFEKNDKSMGGK